MAGLQACRRCRGGGWGSPLTADKGGRPLSVCSLEMQSHWTGSFRAAPAQRLQPSTRKDGSGPEEERRGGSDGGAGWRVQAAGREGSRVPRRRGWEQAVEKYTRQELRPA